MSRPKSKSTSKKHFTKFIIAGVVLVLAILIGFQLAWSGDKFLPGSVILGVDVAGKTVGEVRDELASLLEGHKVIVITEDGTEMARVDVPFDQISLDEVLARDIAYPTLWRLVPGSIWFRGRLISTDTIPAHINVEELVASIPTNPTEGSVYVSNDGQFVAEPVVGFDFDADALRKKLTGVGVGTTDTIVKVAAEAKNATISSAEFTKKSDELETTRQQILGNFTGSLGLMALDLDHGYWSLGINPDRVYTSASTYKLFVAYSMLRAVESGTAGWSDRLNGMSLEACLQTMIIDSDNACPEAWNLKQGYSKVNSEVQAIGELQNTLIGYGNMRTSARDLATFLTKLYRGQLLEPASTEKLIALMKSQTGQRTGIPSGITDGTVADKPGWGVANLDGNGMVNHDAAIVYSDKGDYVLVVLTAGSNFSNIAKIAARVDSYNW